MKENNVIDYIIPHFGSLKVEIISQRNFRS